MENTVMPWTDYNYSISTDFPNGKVFVKSLDSEIRASTIVTALAGSSTSGDTCTITFKDALSVGDKTTLDGVVAAHQGEPTQKVSNFDAAGNPIYAPSFESTMGVSPIWQSYLYNATNSVTSTFDTELSEEVKLRGGSYEICTSPITGTHVVNFMIVDKNDVLGLFAGLGLTPGVDELIVKHYIRDEYVNINSVGQTKTFSANSVSTLVAGLFLRTTYNNQSLDDVEFKVTYIYYE
jgi:hypothetical protein